jgi:restriction system protein
MSTPDMINKDHALFINWIPPLLDVLREKGGSATTKEVRDGIAEKMKLSDNVLSERYVKSGSLKFDNQVYWAKQYLAWEKLVTISKRGVWALTDIGGKTTLTYDDALKLFFKWVKINQETRKNRNGKQIADIAIEKEDGVETEDDAETEEILSLPDILKKTTPTGFERLCGRLLREYDFEDIEVTKRSYDGGIDGTAILKINPFVKMSVYFQCKRYEGCVPISHIREFIGVLETEKHGVEKGLFITTGTLPISAYELEKKNTKLELIDGEKLVEMFEKAELGVSPRTVYDPDLTFFSQYMKE